MISDISPIVDFSTSSIGGSGFLSMIRDTSFSASPMLLVLMGPSSVVFAFATRLQISGIKYGLVIHGVCIPTVLSSCASFFAFRAFLRAYCFLFCVWVSIVFTCFLPIHDSVVDCFSRCRSHFLDTALPCMYPFCQSHVWLVLMRASHISFCSGRANSIVVFLFCGIWICFEKLPCIRFPICRWIFRYWLLQLYFDCLSWISLYFFTQYGSSCLILYLVERRLSLFYWFFREISPAQAMPRRDLLQFRGHGGRPCRGPRPLTRQTHVHGAKSIAYEEDAIRPSRCPHF